MICVYAAASSRVMNLALQPSFFSFAMYRYVVFISMHICIRNKLIAMRFYLKIESFLSKNAF